MEFKEKIKNLDPYTPHKTMFLTLSEQAQLRNRLKDDVVFDGGYSNPERQRAYINTDSMISRVLKLILIEILLL